MIIRYIAAITAVRCRMGRDEPTRRCLLASKRYSRSASAANIAPGQPILRHLWQIMMGNVTAIGARVGRDDSAARRISLISARQ